MKKPSRTAPPEGENPVSGQAASILRPLLRALPAALWYALIFWFSSKSAAVSGGQSGVLLSRALDGASPAFRAAGAELRAFAAELLSFPVRKCAHMFLYFVLAALLLPALTSLRRRGLRAGATLAWCGVLAALDEYHQTFVPGRSGELRDVLVDLAGGALLLGLWAFALWARSAEGRRLAPRTLALPLLLLAAALAAPLWTGPIAAAMAERFVDGFSLLDAGSRARLLAGASPILREALTAGTLALLALWASGLALLRSAGGRRG